MFQNDQRYLIVTSVRVEVSIGEPSGHIYIVDTKDKRIVAKFDAPRSNNQPQLPLPQGGLWGARGVSATSDRLVIANSDTLYIFDSAWRLQDVLSHRWMGGVHDILAEEDGIWVTCTASDLLVKLDWSGNLLSAWEWRQNKDLVRSFGFRNVARIRRNHDFRIWGQAIPFSVPNIVHLNGVSRCEQGLLLSFGRIMSPPAYRKSVQTNAITSLFAMAKRDSANSIFDINKLRRTRRKNSSSSAIVLLKHDGNATIVKHIQGVGCPNHNALQIDGRLIYNDTNRGLAVSFDQERQIEQTVKVPGRPSFVRGLVHHAQQRFIVGNQNPAVIYWVDFDLGEVVDSMVLSTSLHESIYAISPIPMTFAISPPLSMRF